MTEKEWKEKQYKPVGFNKLNFYIFKWFDLKLSIQTKPRIRIKLENWGMWDGFPKKYIRHNELSREEINHIIKYLSEEEIEKFFNKEMTLKEKIKYLISIFFTKPIFEYIRSGKLRENPFNAPGENQLVNCNGKERLIDRCFGGTKEQVWNNVCTLSEEEEKALI